MAVCFGDFAREVDGHWGPMDERRGKSLLPLGILSEMVYGAEHRCASLGNHARVLLGWGKLRRVHLVCLGPFL